MHCSPEPTLVSFPPDYRQAINILVADDHCTLRSQLIEILAEAFPWAAFCEAGDGEVALAKLSQHVIDLLLLDINMPRRSGLEILPEVRTLFPHTKVIIVSVHPEAQYAARVLDAGAHAYLNKDEVPDELIRTVESVMSIVAAGKSGSEYVEMHSAGSAVR